MPEIPDPDARRRDARRRDARQRTEGCLSRIDAWNPRLGAIITPLHTEARQQADELDTAAARGEPPGLLHGMPMSVKDSFATAGIRTTMGSGVYANHVPAADAEVVRRLRDAGAVLVAKDNMHEFASGQTTQNPHFGRCHNPWDTERLPGGSSGGSAVTAATGMATASVGTDAGGSVRAPAALCGVAGLRPTMGAISGWNDGLPDIAEFSVAGPLAREVSDLARVFVTLRGFDPRDPGSRRGPEDDLLGTLEDGIRGLRIGVAAGPWFSGVESDVTAAVQRAIEALEGLGAQPREIVIPGLEENAGHNHAIRWSQGAAVLARAYDQTPELLGADVRASIEDGRTITGTAYADAVIWRQSWRRAIEHLFTEVDVIVSPTCPVTAPLITAPSWWMPIEGTLLRHWSMGANPSLSLPCGFDRNGLPIGIEVAGPWWGEAGLLRLGVAFQGVTDWHRQMPPIP